MRVKSQIGTANSSHRFANSKLSINEPHNLDVLPGALPSKFVMSKERRVGNSQEGRFIISTKNSRDINSAANMNGSLISMSMAN